MPEIIVSLRTEVLTSPLFYSSLCTKPGNGAIDHVYVLFRFMVVNATSTIFQLYRGGQFYCWRKPEKITDMSQVNDTVSHNVVTSTPRLSGIRTHNCSGDRHLIASSVINPTTLQLRPSKSFFKTCTRKGILFGRNKHIHLSGYKLQEHSFFFTIFCNYDLCHFILKLTTNPSSG